MHTKHYKLKHSRNANTLTVRALRDWDDGKITSHEAINRIRKANGNQEMFEHINDFYCWADSLGYLRMHEKVAELIWKGYVTDYEGL